MKELKEFDICEWVIDTVAREVVGRDRLIEDIECSWPSLADAVRNHIEVYGLKPPPTRGFEKKR